ncbi:MAG: hypothetical protein ACJ8F7_03450 [Gemmataceae bacterium]
MTADPSRSFVYTLLTIGTLALVSARVARTEFVFEPSMYRAPGDTSPDAPPRDWPKCRPTPMPTFSSNDRSRWCTVRALVDHGTFVIGHRDVEPDDPDEYYDRGIVFEDGWQTVDKVLNPQTLDFYSSKPPLLTLLTAGEYWCLKRAFGWTITGDPNKVVKTILITFNVIPLAIYLLMLRRLLEEFAATEWARFFLFAVACFGTYITTFAVSLNNHTPAAVTALVAVYPFLTAVPAGQRWGRIPLPPLPSNAQLIIAGFFAGLTACLELPALAFLAAQAIAIFLRRPLRSLLFVVPALLVFSSEFGLNYIAVSEWWPIYGKVGSVWYRYPGSHWLKQSGIDAARLHESIFAYIFHCLIGHHGLFSLTPIWLISFAGMIRGTRDVFRNDAGITAMSFLQPLMLAVSVVVIGFYLVTSTNYGGWTSGLRWLFWLTPLWLLMAQPAADRLAGSPWGRRLAYAALAVSVFSASYPVWNPWRHPWLYQLCESQGWVRY